MDDNGLDSVFEIDSDKTEQTITVSEAEELFNNLTINRQTRHSSVELAIKMNIDQHPGDSDETYVKLVLKVSDIIYEYLTQT